MRPEQAGAVCPHQGHPVLWQHWQLGPTPPGMLTPLTLPGWAGTTCLCSPAPSPTGGLIHPRPQHKLPRKKALGWRDAGEVWGAGSASQRGTLALGLKNAGVAGTGSCPPTASDNQQTITPSKPSLPANVAPSKPLVPSPARRWLMVGAPWSALAAPHPLPCSISRFSRGVR